MGYSHANIALASSISIWGQAGLLWILLDKKGLWWGNKTLKPSIIKSIILAAIMGILLWAAQQYLLGDIAGFWQNLWALLTLSFGAMGFWLLGAKYLGLIARFRS